MRKKKKSALAFILTIMLALTTILSSKEVWAEEIYPEPPEISGEAAILLDIDTGAVLYEKNADEKLYPASITKIMTALLAVENCSLDGTFTFTPDIINALPWDAAKYGYVAGEQVNIKDLLHVLLLRSANEVAIGLGISIAGSEEEFGKMMTQRAKEAGAVNTNFVNASGLHDDNHYTTARDMAYIAKAAISNPTFAEVWGQASYIVQPTNVEPDIVRIWNRHEMLVDTTANYYQYAKGGKTGYTDEAGRTLVTYASKDGMNLICVVMKSDTQAVYDDTRALFEYGFNNFTKVKVDSNETRFGQSEDSYFVSHENLFDKSSKLLTLGDDYVTIPKDMELSRVDYQIEYYPKTGNDDIAVIRYIMGGHYLGETTLTINSDGGTISELSPYAPVTEETKQKKEPLPINIWMVAGALAVVVVLIIVIRIMRSTKSKRKAKRERKKYFKGSKLH